MTFVQVFAKMVTVCTYFDVSGETRGFFFFFFFVASCLVIEILICVWMCSVLLAPCCLFFFSHPKSDVSNYCKTS